MIKVEHLYKTYNEGKKNEEKVLKDVSLEFGRTGLVCLLGESGSGKTTLLNTIGGLDTFSGGTITIDQTTLKGYNPKVMEPIRNDRFDYIFQNYYLLGDHTVAYNVKLALNRFDISEEEKEERVEYVLNMLGMGKYKKKQVSKLSGGQQQRVSIARALVKSPDIILADEPTGNLDEENTLRTMSILKSISKECLVLLVTHERRIADFFADRIIEIRDGEVIRDVENVSADSYERGDDANIYLKEMECKTLANDFANFRIYVEGAEKADLAERGVGLSLAFRDGKLYIKNHMNCDVILEGEESGIHMVDEYRPKFDVEEMEKVAYNLPKLKSKGSANLAFKEILRMALENIRLMGKKQAFVIGVLIATGILLSVVVADFINTVSVDEESIVTTDSHYLYLDFAKVSSLRDEESQMKIMEFAWEHLADNPYGTAFATPTVNLYLQGEGYEQMENLLERLTNYCYVSKDYLDESMLLYGKMPTKRDEVVLDIRVVNQLLKSGGVISSMLEKPENFVGKSLFVATTNVEVEIVGICDSGQSNIYCGQNVLLSFPTGGVSVASIAELQAQCPGEYDDLQLADNEVLMRESMYESSVAISGDNTMTLGDDNTHEYTIVGTFPDSLDANYVMSDQGCINARDVMIYEMKICMFYSNDQEAALSYFEDVKNDYKNHFVLQVSVPHVTQVEAYKEANQVDLDAKYLIALICTVLSLVMVYFTVKSNAVSRIEELTVYRLIGISKKSILQAYVLEMFFMTCYTSLPAVLLTSAAIKIISAIPSLQVELTFPAWAVAALLVAIYLIHSFISILPVYGILSQPPAKLAVKE